jgi:uncharacterized protein YqeY
MATLVERLEEDYKTAMKAGDRPRVATVRLLKAGVATAAIDKRKPSLDDQEAVEVIAHQAKQCRETIESAKRANREDILAQATAELAIVASYLPPPLSEEDITWLIDEAIAAVGKQHGPVMKQVMAQTKGRAEGAVVNRLVGERLKSVQH